MVWNCVYNWRVRRRVRLGCWPVTDNIYLAATYTLSNVQSLWRGHFPWNRSQQLLFHSDLSESRVENNTSSFWKYNFFILQRNSEFIKFSQSTKCTEPSLKNYRISMIRKKERKKDSAECTRARHVNGEMDMYNVVRILQKRNKRNIVERNISYDETKQKWTREKTRRTFQNGNSFVPLPDISQYLRYLLLARVKCQSNETGWIPFMLAWRE